MRSRAILFFGVTVLAAFLNSGHIFAQDNGKATSLQEATSVVNQEFTLLQGGRQTCIAVNGLAVPLFSDQDRTPNCCGQCRTPGDNPVDGCNITTVDGYGNTQTTCNAC